MTRNAFLLSTLVAATTFGSASAAAAGDERSNTEYCQVRPSECGAAFRRPPPPPVLFVRADPPNPNPMPAREGWQVGVRVGVAHPGGQLGAGSPATTPNLSDLAETALPLGIDAGYRIVPALYLGASLVWAPAFGDASTYCAACGFRYDVQATSDLRVYLLPYAFATPWLSFGSGWEVLHVSFTPGDATYQGPIVANLQAGVDLRKGRVAFGPYVGAAFAVFSLRSLDPSPPNEPVPAYGIHEWFTLGLHGSYGP
jgi:hypothetical protein